MKHTNTAGRPNRVPAAPPNGPTATASAEVVALLVDPQQGYSETDARRLASLRPEWPLATWREALARYRSWVGARRIAPRNPAAILTRWLQRHQPGSPEAERPDPIATAADPATQAEEVAGPAEVVAQNPDPDRYLARFYKRYEAVTGQRPVTSPLHDAPLRGLIAEHGLLAVQRAWDRYLADPWWRERGCPMRSFLEEKQIARFLTEVAAEQAEEAEQRRLSAWEWAEARRRDEEVAEAKAFVEEHTLGCLKGLGWHRP